MTKKWTDEDILKWSQDSFGVVTPIQVATRMNKEFAELLSAIANGEIEEAVSELPDLRIMLGQLHAMLVPGGDTLSQTVDHKMDINQERKWTRASDGSFQHVEIKDE